MNPGSDETAHPLAVGNFRLVAAAQLLGGCGMWMIRLTTNWLAFEISGSSQAVGLLVALQFLPMLLLGPWAGVLADRYPKRRLVIAAQSAQMVLAIALAIITWNGGITLAAIYASAVVMGVISAVDQPARQVLVGETVGDRLLVRAIGMSNAFGQLGGLVGPLLAAAVLAQAGAPWTFLGNAAIDLAVITLVLAMRTDRLIENERVPRRPGQLREGLRYVASQPSLAGIVLLAGAMGMLGMNGPVVLTAFAENVWGNGANGFAVANTVSSIGAITALVLVLPRLRTGVKAVVIASATFAVVEALAALAPTYPIYLVGLVLVAAATLTFLTLAATHVQVSATPAMRGRAMAIYTPLLLGGHALGGLFQGWTTEALGVRPALVLTGALALTVTAGIGWWLRGHTGRLNRYNQPRPSLEDEGTSP